MLSAQTHTKAASARRRWVGLVLLVMAGVLLVPMVSAPPAAAHALLSSTDPTDGAVLPASPKAITLTFNEPVTAGESIAVLDAAGARQPVGVAVIDTKVRITPTEELADGTIVVTWRVVSADGHPISGAFTFSVGAPSAQAPRVATTGAVSETDVTVIRYIVQGVTYVGLFAAAGLVLFELFFLAATPGGMPRVRRRLATTARGSAAAAVVGSWLSVPLTLLWQQGQGWAAVTDGVLWSRGAWAEPALAAGLISVGLLVAIMASPMVNPRSGTTHRSLAVAGVTLAGTSLLVGGHTRGFGPVWLVLAADAVHVIAGIVWVGGVLGLMLVMAAGSDASSRRTATTTSRFSAAAAAAVSAVAVAGLTLGWRILGSLEALTSTVYGRTLLIKTGLVLVVVALAAYNRWVLLPRAAANPDRPTPAPLVAVVRAEGAVLVAVLLATGFLTGQSPVPEVTGSTAVASPSAASAAPVTFEQPLGEGTVRARITPAKRGINVLELTLLDAGGQPVRPVEPPTVDLTLTRNDGTIGPLRHPVSATGPGGYQASIDFPFDGFWVVQVSVRTSKYGNPIAKFSVTVP